MVAVTLPVVEEVTVATTTHLPPICQRTTIVSFAAYPLKAIVTLPLRGMLVGEIVTLGITSNAAEADDAPDEKNHHRGVAYTPGDGGRVVVRRRK